MSDLVGNPEDRFSHNEDHFRRTEKKSPARMKKNLASSPSTTHWNCIGDSDELLILLF